MNQKSRHIIIVLSLVLLCLSSDGQELKLSQKVELDRNLIGIEADQAGNLYFISDQQEIIRLNDSARLLGNFRDRYLGDCSLLDIYNPLRLLVFYPDRSVVLELDNMLDPKRTIKLDGLDLSDNSLICRTYDNNFWLYDSRRFKLIKFDESLEVSIEGEWIRNVVKKEFDPYCLKEYREQVYLLDTTGLFIFDLFGSYKQFLEIRNVDQFDFYGNKLFFSQGSKILVYDLSQPYKMEEEVLNIEGLSSFCVSSGQLFTISGKELRTYSIE